MSDHPTRTPFSELLPQLFGKRNGDDEGSFLDQVQGLLERQALGGFSFGQETGQSADLISARGALVTHRFRLSLLQAAATREIRFLVDGEVRGTTAKLTDRVATFDFCPNTPGAHVLNYDLIGGLSGTTVERATFSRRLYVLGDGPVVLVAADEALRAGTTFTDLARQLQRQGFDLVLADIESVDTAAQPEEVPPVPRFFDTLGTLQIAADPGNFATYDVDFRKVFLELAVRRLRADGAAVVALVASRDALWSTQLAQTVERLTFGDLAESNTRRRLKRQAARFRERRDGSNNLIWRLDRMTRTDALKGNHCHVELDNQLARQEVLRLIDTSQRTIHLQTYIFKGGRFARELCVALIRAARRGVRVRVLVDALWSGDSFLGMTNAELRQLDNEPGIDVCAVDPVQLTDSFDALKFKQRDHRKLLVVDHSTAVISGRNIGDEYYYDWRETPITQWSEATEIPWLDAHITISGPLVDEIETAFAEQWHDTAGVSLPKRRRRVAAKERGLAARLVLHEGVEDANALGAYEALIQGAQRHLYLVNDFPVVDRIADLLATAVRRGVRVRFLTGCVLARRMDGSFFEGERHREAFEYVIKRRFGDLVEQGVEVYELATPVLPNIVAVGGQVRPYVHAKVVTADGHVASVGSANLDITASFWEHEANVIVEDKAFTRRLERRIQKWIRRSWQIDLQSDQWRRETPQRNLVAGLWPDSILT